MSTETPTDAVSQDSAAATVPETPASTPVTTASDSSAPAGAPSDSTVPTATATPEAAEDSRPRVQLNPDPGGMKAVGTVDVIEGAVTPAPASVAPPLEPGSPEAAAVSEGMPVVIPSTEPIEVPRGDKLDNELEAEINAALEGVSLGAGQEVAPEPGAEPAEPAKPLDGSLPKGKRVKAKVVSITSDGIIMDLGVRDSGLLSARSFEEGKAPEVGAEMDVVVDRYDPAEGLIHVRPAKNAVSKPTGNWDQIHVDDIVDCMVTKTNKGGLEVTVSNIRGFLPASQIDFGFVQNMDQYVGQKLRVKITEVNPAKRNLVVSRRSFMQIERDQNREKIWSTLAVGQVLMGTVKTIKDYGAFVDIGGVDGLLHVGELSWNRVNHPKDVLKENQQVEVKILSIDQEKQKIGLGMKQMQSNPWAEVEAKYPPKTTIHGKVTKTTEFGAFVQIEPGVEGLIHISELDHKRVVRVTDVVKVDQEVDAQVLSVDIDKKRIALSLKSLSERPQSMREPKKKDEDLAPSGGSAYERKRRGPLKGGGTGSGGLTFGGSPE